MDPAPRHEPHCTDTLKWLSMIWGLRTTKRHPSPLMTGSRIEHPRPPSGPRARCCHTHKGSESRPASSPWVADLTQLEVVTAPAYSCLSEPRDSDECRKRSQEHTHPEQLPSSHTHTHVGRVRTDIGSPRLPDQAGNPEPYTTPRPEVHFGGHLVSGDSCWEFPRRRCNFRRARAAW